MRPALLGLLGALLSGCFAASSAVKVTFDTTFGPITVELDRDKAPRTVGNFLQYVEDGHYDGTVFHRVIPKFVAQGGGFDGRFSQKPTREPVENESGNGLSNVYGTIAMARLPDPHSATAQFYFNLADNTNLDYRAGTPPQWGYTVFGKVVGGLEILARIESVPTGSGGPFPRDVPQTPVVIQKARVAE